MSWSDFIHCKDLENKGFNRMILHKKSLQSRCKPYILVYKKSTDEKNGIDDFYIFDMNLRPLIQLTFFYPIQLKTVIVIVLLFNCCYLYATTPQNKKEAQITLKDTVYIDSLRLKGLKIHRNHSDSAIIYIKQAIKMSETLNDQVRIAKGLNCLGIAYRTKSNYKKASNLYKRALTILEKEESPDTKSAVYNNLGNIYLSFGLYDLAEEYYLISIKILNKTKSTYKEKFLNHTYGNLSQIYRYQGDYMKSLEYVTKAIEILQPADIDIEEKRHRNAGVYMDKGMTYLKMGKYDIAKEIFFSNYSIVEEYGEKISIAKAHYYIGSLYQELKEYDKAISYFTKAIALTDENDSLQHKVNILLGLASVYSAVGQDTKAYKYLEKGTILKDSLFGARNTWGLYEVKENYEKEQQRQELQLKQKEKKIDTIVKGVYLFGGILISLFGLLYFRYLRSKHKREKMLIQKERQITELELVKTKEILEVKNKELTTSALRIIENGELIRQFKTGIQEIKEQIPEEYYPKLERLSSSIQNNSAKNWEEFKIRFEQVNGDFFNRIKKEYPSLSPTELKLCSFLKLNFSSKDIANLMGISAKSVKMGRYRLRKKFNLSRDTNLVIFISKF